MPDKARMFQILVAAGACLSIASLSPPARAGTVTVDLGQAPAGTIDELEIEARNDSCDEPQDFRFAPRDLPWIKLVNGSNVRAVARGKSKMSRARIDLTGMKPGHYAGRLDIICDTCGDFVMSRCHIDTESVAIRVEIVARGARSNPGADVTVRALSD